MDESPAIQDDDFGTQRLEAFSDGVFAIAITLLIIEIKVPHLAAGEGESLTRALLGLWTSYFAYALSFLSIGIYWANHHAIFKLYRKTDHLFILLNVLFLMCISFLPFPTAVLADYIDDSGQRGTAVTFYTVGLLLPALSWMLMWLYASANYRLIDRRLEASFVRHLTMKFLASVVIYLAAVIVSFWSYALALVVCVGLTFSYLLPTKKSEYVSTEGN